PRTPLPINVKSAGAPKPATFSGMVRLTTSLDSGRALNTSALSTSGFAHWKACWAGAATANATEPATMMNLRMMCSLLQPADVQLGRELPFIEGRHGHRAEEDTVVHAFRSGRTGRYGATPGCIVAPALLGHLLREVPAHVGG